MAIMRVTDHRDFQALGQWEVWESLRGTACIHSSIHSLLGSRSQKSQKMGTKVLPCFSKKTHAGGEKAGGGGLWLNPASQMCPQPVECWTRWATPHGWRKEAVKEQQRYPALFPELGPSRSRYHLRLTRFKLLLLGLHLREEESRVRCEGSCLPAFHLSHLKLSSIFSLPPSI